MLINLVGTVDVNGQIDFDDMPMIMFGMNDFVSVTEMFICYDDKMSNINGYLSSTLIDRSPINCRQQLIFFYHLEKSRFFYYTPTHLAKYKILCSDLQSSFFQLHLSEADKILNFREKPIQKIYIQLKIETDAGIFRNN